ncbi:unnamed protein product [Oppiella nova]|uniref:G-protein coupled receptors family 1 profile domain-containing protein n=1 Tax=Oppiella nova TaxID=334625 RepID=A0A7R9QGF3_9ACAR|nr:unnamed protein product [Oppiella nova]CAG2165356.1 unnamed protein product [Oppiella nova]
MIESYECVEIWYMYWSRDSDYHLLLNESKRVDIFNNSIDIYDTRDEILAIIEISILTLMFVSILFGNSFVLMALVVRKQKMNRMYYYFHHLCIGDLMCGFFNGTVLPQLAWDITYRFYGGNILCKVVKYLQILGPYLSSYILVITAIDRYQAICHPLRNCSWTQRRSQLMIIMAWMLSLILCCPQLYIFSYQQIPNMPNVYDCWATFTDHWERIYVTWYAITRESIEENQNSIRLNCKSNGHSVNTCFINSSTDNHSLGKRMTYSMRQSKAAKRQTEVRKSRNSLPNISLVGGNGVNSTPRTHSLRFVSRAKIKTVKITVVIMLCYIMCSTPFIMVQLWVHWFPQTQHILNTNSFITSNPVTRENLSEPETLYIPTMT